MPNLLALSFEGTLTPAFDLHCLDPSRTPPDGWGRDVGRHHRSEYAAAAAGMGTARLAHRAQWQPRAPACAQLAIRAGGFHRHRAGLLRSARARRRAGLQEPGRHSACDAARVVPRPEPAREPDHRARRRTGPGRLCRSPRQRRGVRVGAASAAREARLRRPRSDRGSHPPRHPCAQRDHRQLQPARGARGRTDPVAAPRARTSADRPAGCGASRAGSRGVARSGGRDHAAASRGGTAATRAGHQRTGARAADCSGPGERDGLGHRSAVRASRAALAHDGARRGAPLPGAPPHCLPLHDRGRAQRASAAPLPHARPPAGRAFVYARSLGAGPSARLRGRLRQSRPPARPAGSSRYPIRRAACATDRGNADRKPASACLRRRERAGSASTP